MAILTGEFNKNISSNVFYFKNSLRLNFDI